MEVESFLSIFSIIFRQVRYAPFGIECILPQLEATPAHPLGVFALSTLPYDLTNHDVTGKCNKVEFLFVKVFTKLTATTTIPREHGIA